MDDSVVVLYNGEPVSVPKEVAEFLEQERNGPPLYFRRLLEAFFPQCSNGLLAESQFSESFKFHLIRIMYHMRPYSNRLLFPPYCLPCACFLPKALFSEA